MSRLKQQISVWLCHENAPKSRKACRKRESRTTGVWLVAAGWCSDDIVCGRWVRLTRDRSAGTSVRWWRHTGSSRNSCVSVMTVTRWRLVQQLACSHVTCTFNPWQLHTHTHICTPVQWPVFPRESDGPSVAPSITTCNLYTICSFWHEPAISYWIYYDRPTE